MSRRRGFCVYSWSRSHGSLSRRTLAWLLLSLLLSALVDLLSPSCFTFGGRWRACMIPPVLLTSRLYGFWFAEPQTTAPIGTHLRAATVSRSCMRPARRGEVKLNCLSSLGPTCGFSASPEPSPTLSRYVSYASSLPALARSRLALCAPFKRFPFYCAVAWFAGAKRAGGEGGGDQVAAAVATHRRGASQLYK